MANATSFFHRFIDTGISYASFFLLFASAIRQATTRCGALLLLGLSVMPVKGWAHAEKTLCLQGKLGSRSMALKIVCYDETPDLRYVQFCFADDKRDRYMAGKPVKGGWRFAADVQAVQSNPVPEGSLSIAPIGAAWQGNWVDQTGKKYPVQFAPIPAGFLPLQFSHLLQVRAMDPYERWRLAGLHFTKTTTQTFPGGVQSVGYLEKESGITFFRLGGGAAMHQVNATLEAMHLSLVQQFFAYSPQKTYAKPETKLLYGSGELVSFRTVAVSRFLGITTSHILLATTLDVSTGEVLKLDNLLWLDKTAARPAESDFFSLYQYRKKVFAPTVFQWLQVLYPQQMKTGRCGINKAESWNLPAWNLTPNGLALGVNATDECGTLQWAIIPYGRLQQYLTRKYHLATGQ